MQGFNVDEPEGAYLCAWSLLAGNYTLVLEGGEVVGIEGGNSSSLNSTMFTNATILRSTALACPTPVWGREHQVKDATPSSSSSLLLWSLELSDTTIYGP